MPDHRGEPPVAEREYEADRVADEVEDPKRGDVAVVVAVPTGREPVAALIGREHVVAGLRERHHHLAPAVGKLREAVEQQQAGPAGRLVAGLEHVHAQAVHAVDKARADAGR